MGTTTKMAIPYPEATGLVKDGWEDMKDIATQVDAKSGLVLISTTTFSAIATQSFNNVFSSTFENYRIIYKASSASAVTDVNFRLRANGTDNTSGVYEATGIQTINSGTTLSAMNQTSGATSIKLLYQDNVLPTFTHFVFDLLSPQLAAVTTGTWQSNSVFGATMYGRQGTMAHNSTTQFDGFSLIGVSGNIAGKLVVYGYNF